MPLSSLEQKLFDSVDFCLALLGALPMPVFLVDEQDQCITLSSFDSQSFKGLSFIEDDDITNNWMLDINASDCVFVKAVLKARKTGEKVSLKGRWSTHNNKLLTNMIVAVHAVASELNGTKYIIVIIEDMTELEQLKGLLPICMQCNKIYNSDEEKWDHLEKYISNNSSANFSHGLCPVCANNMKKSLKENNWGKN